MTNTIIRSFYTNIRANAKVIIKKKGASSNEWLSRQFADPFVERAKMMNYRCRSAFKLLEIDQKCNILRHGQTVIDCGAAPGSWTQIAVAKTNANGAQNNKPKGLVIGIDKLQIYPIEGAHLIGNADFTTAKAQEQIRSILKDRKIDCVLSDMAPNATGVRSLDQENIITLCYAVLRFAIQMSTEESSLLVKVWDNAEVPVLEKDMLKYYKQVKVIKPLASRSDSAEKFLLAKGFKGIETTS